MERMPVKSSTIKSVGFKGDILEVEFIGDGSYVYKGVPKEIYDKLMLSESKGKFFSVNIKGKFDFYKVDPNKPCMDSGMRMDR